MNSWASQALGLSATDLLESVRSKIPVALIATARVQFKCQARDRWQAIERDPDLSDFDQVPLIDDRTHIVAVFIRGEGLRDWIRKSCGVYEDRWLDHLDKRQRGVVEKHWKNVVKENLAIDRLSCASFGQEMRAAVGLGLFKGDEPRHRNLAALEALRHKVCHAADFAPTPEHALTIPSHVRDAQATAAWLQAQIEKFPA